MDVDPTEQFAVHPSIICRELSGEIVLLNLESGVYYGLDIVGARVWQMLVQGRTLDDICAVMVEEYDVAAEVLRNDVLRLVGELLERGIVTPRESVQA
jgi:hypothetical protein